MDVNEGGGWEKGPAARGHFFLLMGSTRGVAVMRCGIARAAGAFDYGWNVQGDESQRTQDQSRFPVTGAHHPAPGPELPPAHAAKYPRILVSILSVCMSAHLIWGARGG